MVAPVSSSVGSPSAIATLGQSPRELTRLPQNEQVKAAAGQFEAILLRQFLQDSVGKIMGGAEGGSGSGAGVYSYLLTDILSAKLSEGGGLGLGRVIEQQLSPRYPASALADATTNPPAA